MENTQETLHQLLHDRCLYPEHAAEIDAQIYETFSATRAVMVMDMSGFSRTTVRYGVVHFLTMIQRMNELARPCVEEQGGMVVKFLADNVFAVFPEVIPAMRAAHDLAQCLRDANVGSRKPCLGTNSFHESPFRGSIQPAVVESD